MATLCCIQNRENPATSAVMSCQLMSSLPFCVCISYILYMQTQNREESYFGCEAIMLFYALIAHNEHGKC